MSDPVNMTIEQQRVLVLAVDGGGSKTIAWVGSVVLSNQTSPIQIDVLGRGVAGPSNPRSVGFEVAFDNLGFAVDQAIQQSLITPDTISNRISIACLSLAGVGRTEEQFEVRSWANKRKLANQTIVVNDVEPLRFAAMYESQQSDLLLTKDPNWEQCVTLVVGTGSIACGMNRVGESIRAGGWGYLLGDQGSGFAMGLAGLQSICEAHDRGELLTPFHVALLDFLRLSKPSELVGFLYRNPIPRAEVAELSKVVLAHADNDPAAFQIRCQSIDAMSRLVGITLQRLDLSHQNYSLALSGGILTNNAVMVDNLLASLHHQHQAPQIWHLVQQPIHGSLLMAVQQIKQSVA
jgi:N-acetylglucosamine kinase-like BadF-type ATPase